MSKKDNIKIINNQIDISNFQTLPIKLQNRIKKYGNSALCPICNQLISIQKLNSGNIYCSKHCRYQSQQMKEISRKNISKVKNRYFSTKQGRQHGLRRIKQIFNVDNVFKLKEIQDKVKQTTLTRHGVQCIFSSQKFQHDIKNTNITKYNTQHPMKNVNVKDKALQKRKQKNLQKFGVQYKALMTMFSLQYVQPLFSIQQYRGLNEKYKWKCKICGKQFQSIYTAGKLNTKCQCQKVKHTSSQQIQLANFCSKYFEIKKNWNGVIWPQELDIVIPQIKLAIEFNGLYWHQTSFKQHNYHYQKSIKCKQKGYRLIHIWQDQWKNNKEEIKGKLLKIFNNEEIFNNNEIIEFRWNNVLKGEIIKYPYIENRNGYLIQNCGLFKINKF